MEIFKYTLDKSSKKFICPKCNQKRFVLYVDIETGNYLSNDFGKCDRQQNCNHHKAPQKGKKCYLIHVLKIKSITDKAIKITDINGFISIIPKSQIIEKSTNSCWITEWFLKTSTINFLTNESKYFNNDEAINILSIKKLPPPKEPSYHTTELLENMCKTDNLSIFLNSKFSKDEVFEATNKYFITGSNHFWNNATVFWQIDDKKQIHGGKIMLYNTVTGKRIKEPYNHINWMHKAIKEPDFNLYQCLFGLHRINEDNQKTIALVESEKTAIVMSILLPEFIWLATGSKQNLKFDLLKPIKKRNIVLFPDKGEYSNWLSTSNELNKLSFKTSVSKLIEQSEFGNGFDLADYYLKETI